MSLQYPAAHLQTGARQSPMKAKAQLRARRGPGSEWSGYAHLRPPRTDSVRLAPSAAPSPPRVPEGTARKGSLPAHGPLNAHKHRPAGVLLRRNTSRLGGGLRRRCPHAPFPSSGRCRGEGWSHEQSAAWGPSQAAKPRPRRPAGPPTELSLSRIPLGPSGPR